MALSGKDLLIVMLLVFASNIARSEDGFKQFKVGNIKLSLVRHTNCERPKMDRHELASNLAQYDPSRDPKADIDDETPRSHEEIDLIRRQLVEDGFVYPNGKESIITWMDFDGDGKCDFTTTVGIGGNRSIDRMMLFRNLGNRSFKLVDAHLAYMEVDVTLIPYIPLLVGGEKIPLVVAPLEGKLLRWRKDGQGFESCDATLPLKHPLRLENVESQELEKLCVRFWEIKEWTETRLPQKNRISRWR